MHDFARIWQRVIADAICAIAELDASRNTGCPEPRLSIVYEYHSLSVDFYRYLVIGRKPRVEPSKHSGDSAFRREDCGSHNIKSIVHLWYEIEQTGGRGIIYIIGYWCLTERLHERGSFTLHPDLKQPIRPGVCIVWGLSHGGWKANENDKSFWTYMSSWTYVCIIFYICVVYAIQEKANGEINSGTSITCVCPSENLGAIRAAIRAKSVKNIINASTSLETPFLSSNKNILCL